jgi:hypothetical protein
MNMNGIILYRGPSAIDGQEIVAIATGLRASSTNRKTGAMVQTYILRVDMTPTEAVKQGADASICGDCRHRGDGSGKARTCYVNVGQGPQAVYRAFKAGKYGAWDGSGMTGRIVRLGTYGDPAAVPAGIWAALLEGSAGHTGYTHQWRKAPILRQWCMASADSPQEAAEAQSLGWRTFRVSLPGQVARLEREAVCPASKEAGQKLTCSACLACGGGDRRGSITIAAHGGFAVMAAVRKLAA